MDRISNRPLAVEPIFKTLEYWRDETARSGAENMAVDQLLLEKVGQYPVLRIYQWSEPTISFGYFHSLHDARSAFPGTADQPLAYVRRWTGGGVVDHRVDLTYTLVIPRGYPLADEGGVYSYRMIHQILGETLTKLGQEVRLVAGDDGSHGPVCFSNPVAYDLTDAEGMKIAGAGQRRTRCGLLHQGSLHTGLNAEVLGRELACHLAAEVRQYAAGESFAAQVPALAAGRYNNETWLSKA